MAEAREIVEAAARTQCPCPGEVCVMCRTNATASILAALDKMQEPSKAMIERLRDISVIIQGRGTRKDGQAWQSIYSAIIAELRREIAALTRARQAGEGEGK